MKISLCNEVLAPLPFAEQCGVARALGYDGLEVAPYTVCEDPQAMTVAQAQALKQVESEGVLRLGRRAISVLPR